MPAAFARCPPPNSQLQQCHRQIDPHPHVLGQQVHGGTVFRQCATNIASLLELRAAIVDLGRRHQFLIRFVALAESAPPASSSQPPPAPSGHPAVTLAAEHSARTDSDRAVPPRRGAPPPRAPRRYPATANRAVPAQQCPPGLSATARRNAAARRCHRPDSCGHRPDRSTPRRSPDAVPPPAATRQRPSRSLGPQCRSWPAGSEAALRPAGGRAAVSPDPGAAAAC